MSHYEQVCIETVNRIETMIQSVGAKREQKIVELAKLEAEIRGLDNELSNLNTLLNKTSMGYEQAKEKTIPKTGGTTLA